MIFEKSLNRQKKRLQVERKFNRLAGTGKAKVNKNDFVLEDYSSQGSIFVFVLA